MSIVNNVLITIYINMRSCILKKPGTKTVRKINGETRLDLFSSFGVYVIIPGGIAVCIFLLVFTGIHMLGNTVSILKLAPNYICDPSVTMNERLYEIWSCILGAIFLTCDDISSQCIVSFCLLLTCNTCLSLMLLTGIFNHCTFVITWPSEVLVNVMVERGG